MLITSITSDTNTKIQCAYKLVVTTNVCSSYSKLLQVLKEAEESYRRSWNYNWNPENYGYKPSVIWIESFTE